MLDWILQRFRRLFFGRKYEQSNKQTVFFKNITVLEKTPKYENIKVKEFIEVVFNGKPYWALFKCPCNCGEIISLPLQNTHIPNWNVKHSKNGRPSVYPSIWQNKGCLSHFWINDGRIDWCTNSGNAPSKRFTIELFRLTN
ncbi:MAG TPA: DUF6527 family protein [Bacteroidales bacterium]|nr:DUF6527 family protein [Bacteroidales bacterium]